MADTNDSEDKPLDPIEAKKREAKDRFDRNYQEFVNKKVSEMPCFRSTFLTSIPAGLVASLLTYLVARKPKYTTHVGMGTYMVVTAVYFVQCRRDFDKKVAQNKELGDLMNMIIKYRGTELETQLQQRYKEKCNEFTNK